MPVYAQLHGKRYTLSLIGRAAPVRLALMNTRSGRTGGSHKGKQLKFSILQNVHDVPARFSAGYTIAVTDNSPSDFLFLNSNPNHHPAF
jgi:hypothetical protein